MCVSFFCVQRQTCIILSSHIRTAFRYAVFNAGTVVGRVVVSDADSETLTELRYLIVGGNEGERFAIDPITGDITTSASIDREEAEVYSLVIEVSELHVQVTSLFFPTSPPSLCPSLYPSPSLPLSLPLPPSLSVSIGS